MSISTPFIRRPVATTLLTVALALLGGIAYQFLPVSPLPQVEFPTIQVQTGLPGASPETMASSVATPLERQFGRIAGITEMTSASRLGSTEITLQFDLGRNIDAAGRDVALDELVRGVERPWCPGNRCTTWLLRCSSRSCPRSRGWARCSSGGAPSPPCAWM